MRRVLVAVVVASCAVTGCGSTVQLTSRGAVVPGDGLGAPAQQSGRLVAPAGSEASTVSRGGPVAVLAGSGTARTGVPALSIVSGQGPSASTGSSVPAAGLSSTAPVRVGVLYAQGVEQAAKAFGISGLTTGDTKAQAEAVVAWLNAHGGLAGHKVDPYYYGIKTEDAANNADAAYQTACTSLTQDSKVRFVVTILNLRPGSLPCFSAKGVGVVDDEAGIGDTQISTYAGSFAAPGDFAPGRMLTVLVDDLWRRGWLTPRSKVGSFTYDTTDGQSLVDGPLTDALKAHGLTIASKQRVANDASGVSAASNVALQFQAAGVDRVIPVLASPLFLMNAASSQRYYPAYAMYTSFGPGALMEGTAPKDELKNSAGIGWQPLLDIGAGTHPGPVSPNETTCFDIMRASRQSSTTATVEGFQLQVCTMLFYLKAAAQALPSLPGDLLGASRQQIGATFAPADTFRSDVTHRADGAAGYRSLAYQDDCSCYQYVSPVRPTS